MDSDCECVYLNLYGEVEGSLALLRVFGITWNMTNLVSVGGKKKKELSCFAQATP